MMILFGASSGGFVVLRSSFASRIVYKRNTVQQKDVSAEYQKTKTESLVSGLLMLVRGIATIASGLVGRAIVQRSQNIPLGDGYAADRWQGLVIFVGVMMAATSLGAFGLISRR